MKPDRGEAGSMRKEADWLMTGVCLLGLLCSGCGEKGTTPGGGGNNPGPLVGLWNWNVSNPIGGPTLGELILQADGQFSQTISWNNLMTYDAGTYEAGAGFLHFAVQDHQPTEYNGQPLTWPTSFTYFFTIVTADHIVLEDRIVNTQWDAYRE